MSIEHVFVVKRARPDVFDYFADVENVPEWADNIRAERFTTNGGAEAGARFHEDARIFGLPFRSEWVMDAFDPPEGFSARSESATGTITCRYRFKEVRDGTRVQWTYDMVFRGPAKVAGLFMPGVILRMHRRQFEVAKAKLEESE